MGLLNIDPAVGTTTVNEMLLVKAVAESLNSKYPGQLWAVSITTDGTMLQVRNLRLSGLWGFSIDMEVGATAVMVRKAIMAGGEILERFRVSRSKEFKLSDNPVGVLRDFSGNYQPDL